MKLINIAGQRFGTLTVIKYKGNRRWLCKCDCNNTITVFASNLKNGNTKTCGKGLCCGKIIDLTGKSFNKLKVICLDRIKNGTSYWKCQCACGTIKSIRGSSVSRGKVKSCGNSLCSGLIKDLSGKKFGKLYVLSFSHTDSTYNSCWKCKCDCGKKTIVQGIHLKDSTVKTCGSSLCNNNIKDLSGQVIGWLKVKKPFLRNKVLFWECKCKCGDACNVKASHLLSRDTTSCGCKPTQPNLKNEKRLYKLISDIFPDHIVKTNYKLHILYNKNTKRYQTVDLAIFDKNKLKFVIEYDGEQHFMPVKFGGISDERAKYNLKITKFRDKRKRRILRENNITLLRFTYKDRTKRKEISKNKVIEKLISAGIRCPGK